MTFYRLAVHGGAGTISKSSLSPEMEQQYKSALACALEKGKSILAKKGTALEAVKATVVAMENNHLFNAGKGSVFTNDGMHEMDASIMSGRTLSAGAVAGVRLVKNPVLLADLVMEKTSHVFLFGDGAEALARKYHLPLEVPAYFHDDFRYKQWLAVKDSDLTQLDHAGDEKFGTVGAVARDVHGDLAAATSTGGMTNKRFNRIGDTPIIGAGTYANNNTCAVSCTGHGEFFIRAVVAYDISCLMEYKGLTLADACRTVVMDKLVKLGGEGGLIAVDKAGNICMPFNSEGMYRGSVCDDKPISIEIYQ